MKRLISAAVALGAICASPVLAETWVHSGTSQFTYDSGRDNSLSKLQIVHHVDLESVATSDGLSYFNRKITYYKLESGKWLHYSEGVLENKSRADCGKNALMISPEGRDGIWQYRQSNGEWWTQRQLDRGSRVAGVSTDLFNQLGYNTSADWEADNDSLMSGFYRLICGN